ncbi:hypothetical protein O181_049606 [Austropuccinia psidii MF-1]|uniref:Protein kinase domain-containing protein n=1 Tax=Austropuccinia psidii MF-1 TaxID=1389203 RepID=A0A9Q3HLJ0_9BASI|nr:hypothetical protein [Austropuccinia psidii MF-1]
MGFIEHFNKQPASYVKKKEYKFQEILGQGSFGNVKKAIWLSNQNLEVAIKCIKKKTVQGNENIVLDEIDVLKDLNHPNIVKLHDWFESRDKFYLVFELASGGELFQKICDQGKFTEADAIKVTRATLSGINYLHQHNIVHRDLKPENLLYKSNSKSQSPPSSKSPSNSQSSLNLTLKQDNLDDQLVICDFGIAKLLTSDGEVLTTMCGSPGYAAPEILTNVGHGKPVDLWSIGVITYTLLCGYNPFRSENRAELIKETSRANVQFNTQYWSHVSSSAKGFILALLKSNPEDRLTAEQALAHEWLNAKIPTEYDLSTGLKQHWAANRKLKAAVNAVMATNRMKAMSNRLPKYLNSADSSPSTQSSITHSNHYPQVLSASSTVCNEENSKSYS